MIEHLLTYENGMLVALTVSLWRSKRLLNLRSSQIFVNLEQIGFYTNRRFGIPKAGTSAVSAGALVWAATWNTLLSWLYIAGLLAFIVWQTFEDAHLSPMARSAICQLSHSPLSSDDSARCVARIFQKEGSQQDLLYYEIKKSAQERAS